MTQFRIVETAGVITDLEIDGVALPPPTGFNIAEDEHGIRHLMLLYPAEVDVVGDAEIELVREPNDADVLAVASGWLATLDPENLRPLVTARLQTMRDDPIKKTLEVLAEMLAEAADG